MPTTNFGRRSLMKALGLAGPAYLLPTLRPAAAAAAPPKRLLIFFTAQGSLFDAWRPSGPGGAPPTPTSWELSELLSPLAPWKQKLSLLSGLFMKSHSLSKNGNAHRQGEAHALTNTRQAGGSELAGGVSIDQLIASELKKSGVRTFLPSLEMQTGGKVDQTPCYSGEGQPIALEMSAAKVFQRLFPGGQPIAPTMGAPMPSVDPRSARAASVLDFVAREFASGTPRLSRADRDKLAAHAAVVRDLEKRISTPPAAGPGCRRFAETNLGARADFTADCDRFFRLVQTAFACDLTRVALIRADFPPDGLWGYVKGNHGATDAHDLCHINATTASGPGFEALKKAHAVYVQQFKTLLGLLDGVPESDGRTMLDHTVVLWCGQIGTGGHHLDNLKWLLAGSAGGALQTGRYLNFGNYGSVNDKVGREPHGNLFVSLANAMGVPITSFGAAGMSTGRIAGLHA